MDFEAERLSALERELKRDLEAITRVRQLMAFKNGSLSSHKPEPAPAPINVAAADQLDFDDGVDEGLDAPSTSLRGTIESTVNANPTIRWTVQKMLKHLGETGFELRAQKPVFSVGQAMKKLADQKRISLIRKGSGSAPHIYRGKEKEEKPSV